MGLITKLYTFSTGATIVAAEHNSNFDTVYDEINGEIDSANCDSTSIAFLAETQTFTGVKTFSGANTHSGVCTFSGANTHSGNNTISGNNTFSGTNTHSGTLNITGSIQRSGTAVLLIGADEYVCYDNEAVAYDNNLVYYY